MLLAEANWGKVRNESFEIAILPWGATEAHNFHLPYGTDNFQAAHIAERAASLANGEDARVVVLPAVPFGVNAQQLDIPLTINMHPSTQALVLKDVVDSLAECGIRKLVLLNGHGGNHFRQMVRELQASTPLFLTVIDWFRVVAQEPFFDDLGDHAGEMETSVMMHLRPDIVQPLSEAGPGKARRFRLEGLRDGTAWAPRKWTQVTSDTGVGNPAHATSEKGERYLEAVVERISTFLVELSRADPDDMYEDADV